METAGLEQDEPVGGRPTKNTFDAIAVVEEAESVPQAKNRPD